MQVVDLITPWANDPERFVSHPPAVVSAVCRQRSPTETTLPKSPQLEQLCHRAASPSLQNSVRERVRSLVGLGFRQPEEIVLLASTAPGGLAEPLPDRSGGTVVLFVDRGDDAALLKGLSGAVAMLTRWTHPQSPVAEIVAASAWDRWSASRTIPLLEWYYAAGLAAHSIAVLDQNLEAHQQLGLGRGAYNRLRRDEAALIERIEGDLPRTGAGVVIRWLEDHAPPALRTDASGFTVPVGAGRYLAWRDLRERVERVGVVAACGMET